MEKSRIFGLDFLRCLAILIVVIGHGLVLIPSFGGVYEFFRVFDFLGVEFFFVLSGFLIGTIFLKILSADSGGRELINFWKRRWWRTLPNYYLFLIINIIGFGFLKDDFSFDWKYLFFLQNLTSPNEGFFSVSWSLAVEELFYITIPLIYLFFLRIIKVVDVAILLTIFLVIIWSFVVRYNYIINYEATWNEEIRRVALLRLDSLIYGVAGAWLWLKKQDFLKKYKVSFFLIGTLLISFGIFFRNVPEVNDNTLTLLLLFPIISLGVTFWLPVLASWKSKSARNGLIEKSVVKISLWSYSLYLVHVPLMEGFRIFILSDSIDNSFFQILVFFIWIFCALILSFFIYRFFEKPFTDLRDRKSNGEWLRAFISDFSLIRSKK